MKKRLAIVLAKVGPALALGVLLSALALPGTAAADSNGTFRVVSQHCISGGHNIYFEVSGSSSASSYATKLTIKSTSQYFSGGSWHDYYHWKVDSYKFAKNGQPHTIDYAYSHTDDSSPYEWRIVSELKALEGQHYLAGKTLKSKAC